MACDDGDVETRGNELASHGADVATKYDDELASQSRDVASDAGGAVSDYDDDLLSRDER